VEIRGADQHGDWPCGTCPDRPCLDCCCAIPQVQRTDDIVAGLLCPTKAVGSAARRRRSPHHGSTHALRTQQPSVWPSARMLIGSAGQSRAGLDRDALPHLSRRAICLQHTCLATFRCGHADRQFYCGPLHTASRAASRRGSVKRKHNEKQMNVTARNTTTQQNGARRVPGGGVTPEFWVLCTLEQACIAVISHPAPWARPYSRE